MRLKVETDSSAVDIPEMREMPLEEYLEYVKNELFFIDHHDVLRSAMGEYPLAVTKEQMKLLIQHLQEAQDRVGG